MSDQDSISPYIINTFSSRHVMRIEIYEGIISWSNYKFARWIKNEILGVNGLISVINLHFSVHGNLKTELGRYSSILFSSLINSACICVKLKVIFFSSFPSPRILTKMQTTMPVTPAAPPGVGTVCFQITTPVVFVAIAVTTMTRWLVTAPVHRLMLQSLLNCLTDLSAWFLVRKDEAVHVPTSSSCIPKSRRRTRLVLEKCPFLKNRHQRLRCVWFIMDLLRNTTQKKRNDNRLKFRTCEVQIIHMLLSGLLWGECQTKTFTETDSDSNTPTQFWKCGKVCYWSNKLEVYIIRLHHANLASFGK